MSKPSHFDISSHKQMQEDTAQRLFGKFSGYFFLIPKGCSGAVGWESSSSLCQLGPVGQSQHQQRFIGFEIKRENQKKDMWLHKHEQNKLEGMFFHQQHPLGGHSKKKIRNTGLGEVTEREYMRCIEAKLPATEKPLDNSKRPILLHQEHSSVLKIKKESYKNGNEGIRMSVKGKLKHMGPEQEKVRSRVTASEGHKRQRNKLQKYL